MTALRGSLRESMRELLAELRQQRTRTALSLLGIAWGTLSILLLLAFSVGFEELFLRRSRGLGDGIAICWPSRTTLPWQGLPAGRPITLTRNEVLGLPAAVPAIDVISSEFTGVARLRVADRVLRVSVSGVDPAFATLRTLEALPGGRFVNHADVTRRRRVAFLGDQLAADVFGDGDAVGRSFVLGDASFLVVGVMRQKEQDSDYVGLDRDRMFVPSTAWSELLGRDAVSNFVFRARDPDRQVECTAAVVAAIAARKRFDPHDGGALSVWDVTEQQRMLGFIFLAFHLVLGIAGVVTLLAGGIGIANLMFLLVRRRTAEIGVKLAVGARPAQIRREVLGQTLFLIGVGGALGVAVAILVIAVAGAGPWTSEIGVPRIPTALSVAAVALLLTVGLLAGWFPARSAARLDPAEALRS